MGLLASNDSNQRQEPPWVSNSSEVLRPLLTFKLVRYCRWNVRRVWPVQPVYCPAICLGCQSPPPRIGGLRADPLIALLPPCTLSALSSA